MRFKFEGHTSGSIADFTDIVDVDPADLTAWQMGDPRYSAAWDRVKQELLDSDCDTEYLELFDRCDFEQRDDLTDAPGQHALLAYAYGCDNCAEQGDNEWTDGCDDSPHGSFLLIFTPAAE